MGNREKNGKMDNVHDGHRLRVKARFLSEGLDGFEPHNVLELLLFYVNPRGDTNVIAHELMNRFGSISQVFDAPAAELVKVGGISQNSAILLKLVPELARVYLCDRQASPLVLDTPQKLGDFFVSRFVGRVNEVVYLLCLDTSLNVINCEIIVEGAITSSSLDIRRIVTQVVRHNAWRVVLAHNHPQGLALPSNEDVIVSRDIKHALLLLGIELTDHIIVAGTDWYSLFEQYPDL